MSKESEKKDVWTLFDEECDLILLSGGRKVEMHTFIKTHFIPRAEGIDKYIEGHKDGRKEFIVELIEKIESLDLKVIEVTEAEDKGEWVLKIKHKDLLDLINYE